MASSPEKKRMRMEDTSPNVSVISNRPTIPQAPPHSSVVPNCSTTSQASNSPTPQVVRNGQTDRMVQHPHVIQHPQMIHIHPQIRSQIAISGYGINSWRSRAQVDQPTDFMTTTLPDPRSTKEISAYLQRRKEGGIGQLGRIEERIKRIDERISTDCMEKGQEAENGEIGNRLALMEERLMKIERAHGGNDEIGNTRIEERLTKIERAHVEMIKGFKEGREELGALEKYIAVLASEFNKLAINTQIKKNSTQDKNK